MSYKTLLENFSLMLMVYSVDFSDHNACHDYSENYWYTTQH